MMRYSYLYIVALMSVIVCDTEDPGPKAINEPKQLQQMELHYDQPETYYFFY
ncbi:hypothetical protein QQ020_14735 [Fulvivirgaceae bacterium BMA12]|uniref:Lipoprotein n=1 Tax=Agaribacillus aureus TaxID=3051825 RepID=A0ABT8L6L4_9BACT|nr:hypothetical protein [Fulvivirgaceae bacterium BMA12]